MELSEELIAQISESVTEELKKRTQDVSGARESQESQDDGISDAVKQYLASKKEDYKFKGKEI